MSRLIGLIVVMGALGCSRTPPESQRRDVATGVPHTHTGAPTVNKVLAELAAKRMVVGHTVQRAGVTSACDGRVYRVDVGLSDYYGNNATQVLELRPSGVRVLGGRVVGGSR